MSGFSRRQRLELRLRAELDKAKKQFLHEAPHQKFAAYERVREALDKFTDLTASATEAS